MEYYQEIWNIIKKCRIFKKKLDKRRVPWKTVPPKKIMRMLVLPLQLFQTAYNTP